jgi:hypothetical protein
MTKLSHRFVDHMPPKLEDGVIYISLKFGIVSHNCCCGCGTEVVTNLSPNGWSLIYDGRSVGLYPSIGNWNLKCRSHYWIRNDSVEWAESWEDYQRRLKYLGAAKETKLPQIGLWTLLKRLHRDSPADQSAGESGKET